MSVIHSADLIVRHGKAYVPTTAQLGGSAHGAYLTVAPVYTSSLSLDELTQTLQRALAAGNPTIPAPTEKYQARRDPVLIATGARSWEALAKDGVTYSITWEDDKVELFLPMLDAQGRFASDRGETRVFPPDVDLRSIVAAILEDVQTRPAALKDP